MADARPLGVRREAALVRVARIGLAVGRRIDVRGATGLAAVLAGIALLAVAAPIAIGLYGLDPALGFGLCALHAGSVPLAVVRPRLAGGLAAASALALQALSAGQTAHAWPWWVVLMVTHTAVVLLVAWRVRWPVAVALWLVPITAAGLLVLATGPHPSDAPSINNVVFASISGGVLVLAIAVAQGNRIRDLLVRERAVSAEEHSRRVLAEERARIARELHDVIAHSMSMITVQATTAKYRHPDFDAAAVAEFDEIGASSRQALDEMRTLLDVLRAGDQPDELRPQPRLDDVPELVAQAERAGVDVWFDWTVDGDRVGDVTGLAAYRIVQEALSNSIRHAPGATVHVTGRQQADAVALDVVTLPGAQPPEAPAAGGGHGIVGMTERAASVGGTLTTGPTDEGGFAVRAVLPLRPGGRGERMERAGRMERAS